MRQQSAEQLALSTEALTLAGLLKIAPFAKTGRAAALTRRHPVIASSPQRALLQGREQLREAWLVAECAEIGIMQQPLLEAEAEAHRFFETR